MKSILTIVGIIVLALGIIYGMHLQTKVIRLEGDLTHLNNTIDTRVEKEVNDAKARVTDSLNKHFENLPPVTIIKNRIIYRYDTITKSIIARPLAKQWRFITNELNRLYPSN